MGRFHPAAVVPPLGEFTAMGPLVWLGNGGCCHERHHSVRTLLWPHAAAAAETIPAPSGAFDVGAHPERATASPALCIKATESAAFHVGRPVDDPPSLGHVQAASRALMPRTPRRYAVHLHLAGGQSERVFFPRLELFQEWYQGLANAAGQGASSMCPSVILMVNIWSSGPRL